MQGSQEKRGAYSLKCQNMLANWKGGKKIKYFAVALQQSSVK